VHKAPALDVVGWFTLCPETGPLPDLVPFQKQITSIYNETGILLAIHPEAFEPAQAVNQRLPVTVYESISETDISKDEASMQVDGEESSDIKFRVIPYTVETDEAEMIAIDYVAKGAGSAAAVADSDTNASSSTTAQQQPQSPSDDKKGKKRAEAESSSTSQPMSTTPTDPPPTLDTLTSEEQDQIATIQTRLNSVKMLQSRLNLLTKFLSSLPASYLTSQSIPLTPTSPNPAHLPHLRNIQALLTRLSLLTPSPSPSSSSSDPTPLESASKAQSNDVALTQLLAILNHDVQALSELGRKFAAVDSARSAKKKNASTAGGLGNVGFGGLGDLMGDDFGVPTAMGGGGQGPGGFGGGGRGGMMV
jgi:COP9 signalosome complex subunit 6